MTGRVVHFEVPYDDADRARAFYSDVFGWNIQPMPEFEYNFVQTGPTDDNGMPAEPAYIGGGMLQRQEDDRSAGHHDRGRRHDQGADALAEHGGAAVGDPQPVGEMGIAAYFKDSEGNLMGLWQSTGPS